MRRIDHSSCNWDGDDVIDGCPALIIFRMSIQGRNMVTAHDRSTYKIELNSSEHFPRQISQYQQTMKVRRQKNEFSARQRDIAP
jgi:hypothetical protein